ncbi:hypothetical protein TPELB_24720 [Terrisporobacter petrolearius]|uniref:Uncharacterized protein n=1 Tax=Terrisporobacter petrolearius TaxID=1460447 RepID=A0ABZ3FGN1_9FIRM
MKKEDILMKSREENKNGDEMELKIQERNESNAFNVTLGIFGLLTIIAFILKDFMGYMNINIDYFVLVLMIGIGSKGATEYFYNREKKIYLILSIIIGVGAVAKILTLFEVI